MSKELSDNPCQKCGKHRVARMTAKCSDMCRVDIGANEHNGYVPGDMGIGGDDYVKMRWCLQWGVIQGEFPLPETALEAGEDCD